MAREIPSANQRTALIRAGRDIVGKRLIRQGPATPMGECQFMVGRGSREVVVRIDPTWSNEPICSCGSSGPRCAHVVAVLLDNRSQIHQLLPLFV